DGDVAGVARAPADGGGEILRRAVAVGAGGGELLGRALGDVGVGRCDCDGDQRRRAHGERSAAEDAARCIGRGDGGGAGRDPRGETLRARRVGDGGGGSDRRAPGDGGGDVLGGRIAVGRGGDELLGGGL